MQETPIKGGLTLRDKAACRVNAKSRYVAGFGIFATAAHSGSRTLASNQLINAGNIIGADVSRSQLYRWRQLLREGRLGGVRVEGFVPAAITPEAPRVEKSGSSRGWMEVVSTNSRRIIADRDNDPDSDGRSGVAGDRRRRKVCGPARGGESRLHPQGGYAESTEGGDIDIALLENARTLDLVVFKIEQLTRDDPIAERQGREATVSKHARRSSYPLFN